jgi:acetyltransferase-like isoleucine patch superfamily enzyme
VSTIGRRLRWRLTRGWFGRLVREAAAQHPYVYGEDPSRVSIAPGVVLNDALLNCSSGRIRIERDVFFGHSVSVLTGSHDYSKLGPERQQAYVRSGRDIVIGEGSWIATNATIVGPCRIGEHAVVAAGAVVVHDVPAYAIVAGVPAKTIAYVRH